MVNTWTEPKIKVVVRKKVVADNEEEGKKIDGETQPTFTTVRQPGDAEREHRRRGQQGCRQRSGSLSFPHKGSVDISTRRGDIRIPAVRAT